METPTDAPATFTQRLTRGFIALVIVLVLYVLSIGPAQGFLHFQYVILTATPRGIVYQRTDGPLFYFYTPVVQTANATGLLPMLSSYCAWWDDIANRCRGKS